MADAVQSYQKHTRWVPPFHFFVIPVLLINVINSARHLWMDPTRHFGWELVFALALAVSYGVAWLVGLVV